MAKRIDVAALDAIVGTTYPTPYDEPCRTRARTRLGDAAGLTQYGVNLLRLPPGAWSSQRHWHTAGDEFMPVRALSRITIRTAALGARAFPQSRLPVTTADERPYFVVLG